jgi:hypothetical protein
METGLQVQGPIEIVEKLKGFFGAVKWGLFFTISAGWYDGRRAGLFPSQVWKVIDGPSCFKR